ncbi:hypothetical protein SCP_0401820 [Sparassis crispa]|uniref:Uncharacterized protein n=1 Tax=Sparassis crispa TaxID=139825 RepID=A0A401GI19_9APHY|nr:hypothetical protein SCP_0401820 [Sparassis crispa]GBE81809.1 hypothetical protein SCP_0401820 [Sparassis crispa]
MDGDESYVPRKVIKTQCDDGSSARIRVMLVSGERSDNGINDTKQSVHDSPPPPASAG